MEVSKLDIRLDVVAAPAQGNDVVKSTTKKVGPQNSLVHRVAAQAADPLVPLENSGLAEGDVLHPKTFGASTMAAMSRILAEPSPVNGVFLRPVFIYPFFVQLTFTVTILFIPPQIVEACSFGILCPALTRILTSTNFAIGACFVEIIDRLDLAALRATLSHQQIVS